MRIKITSDSTCDLTPELIAENDISIIRLSVIKDGKSYRDCYDITPEEIFAHVDAGGDLCSTAAINVGEYAEFFTALSAEYDAVIHINLGSGFSSCYQNACIASADLDNVFVIDSQNLSTGQGHVVMEACRTAAQCSTMDDVRAGVEELRELTARVEASFLLNRLEYMVKGGRCSAVAALGANLLKLRPSIEVKDGKMRVSKKYRGNYDKCLAAYIKDRLADRSDIIYDRAFVTYTVVQDNELDAVRKAIAENSSFAKVYESIAGCTVSCHCGPECLGVLFIRKKEETA